MIEAIPSEGLFCVCDPDGALIHTTVARTEQDSVFMWMEIQASQNAFRNVAREYNGQKAVCLSSWDGYEAEGYSVVPVKLIPEN